MSHIALGSPNHRALWPSTDLTEAPNPVTTIISSLRSWALGVAGISFVVNLLGLTGPIFMLQVYDRVLVSGSVPTLIAIGCLTLVLYLFFGLLEGLRSRILLRIGQQVDARLSAETFALSNLIPIKSGSNGRTIRPVQDLESVTNFMSGNGPAAVFDVPWLPIYLGVVFLLHQSLGYVALAGAVTICALVALNELVSRKPSAVASQMRARRAALVEEGRRNAETVKAMGMADALSDQWERENDQYLSGQRSAADWSGFFSSAIKTLRFILQSAILGLGAWLAINREISPGVMIAASIITSRALSPVEQAVAHWRGFVSARQGFIRLKNALKHWSSSSHNTVLPRPSKRLEIDQLYCSPAGTREPIVQNISLELHAGEGIAILGPSGSGKSTLVKSIVGAAHVSRGEVRLDGATLDQWSDNARGGFVGYLPQDLHLFDGTVAQNISRFLPGATSEQVIEAARMADVHDLIVNLPNGYDTVIGSSGLSLSGGQQQRIALARALFGDPFLIVLDEPNSNLDAEGEGALAEALLRVRSNGAIVVIVAHRPRALSAVNRVMCLNNGRVVAIGPKEEVMRNALTPVKTAAGG